jgi:Ca2+-binding EF-hand superfamily protein
MSFIEEKRSKMKKLIMLSSVALMVASSFTMAAGNGKNQHTFEVVDLNADGGISSIEFNAMIEANQTRQAEKQAERMKNRPTFVLVDTDNDKGISEQEFNAMQDSHKQNKADNNNKGDKGKKGNKGDKQKNRTTFAMIDTDSNGIVSEQEFNEMLKEKAIKQAERQAEKIKNRPTFEAMDTDGNGIVSKAEFDAFHQQRMAMNKQQKNANK